nr:hypothetical protein [Tanacetum cinerariifolium]
MLQKDMETGEINSKETLELIKRTLIDYQAQAELRKEKENPPPYQRIMNKLKSQGRNDLSKEEILEEYLKEMKEDLVKNFEYQKSDSSMKASSEDENQFNCLAGESQELEGPEEIHLEDIFEEIKNTIPVTHLGSYVNTYTWGTYNPSYANALNEEENEDLQEYHQSPYKEKIILLEYQDVMRYFNSGNDPWIMMSRYLDNAPYAAHAYKGRTYYENILKFTGSIELPILRQLIATCTISAKF